MSTPTHRPGCSEQRNTKCLCEYLSQWDSKPALNEEIHNTDNPGFESGLTARYGLPVVIVSGDADPAEVAEKIVRDNPHWFGELPPESYIKREPGRTPGDEAAFDKHRSDAKYYRRRFIIMFGLALAGWGTALAIAIWGN